jgi:hypothetical protein
MLRSFSDLALPPFLERTKEFMQSSQELAGACDQAAREADTKERVPEDAYW